MIESLVVGSNGQLGKALTSAFVINKRKFFGSNKENSDLNSLKSIIEMFEKLQPKNVINCAALTDVNFCERFSAEAYNVNTILAENIAIAATTINARLIHISTDFVFAGKQNVEMLFNSPTDPISEYGRSKESAEIRISKVENLNYSILRTGALYGGHKSNFPKYIIENVRGDRLIKLASDQLNQPTHVNYIIELVLEIIEKDINLGIFHATSTGLVSKYEFAKEICRLLDLPTNNLVASKFEDMEGSQIRPKYSNLTENRHEFFGFRKAQSWNMQLEENLQSLRFLLLKDLSE